MPDYGLGIVGNCLKAYDVEEAYERWTQNILAYVSQSITNALFITSSKLSISCTKISISYNDPSFLYSA